MHWVARVTRAAEENRLELFFQPIRPIARGGATAFHELTVRLRDDDGRLVSPGEFIPAAERYNVMSVIDRWVVQRAIERLKDGVGRSELLEAANAGPRVRPGLEARQARELTGTGLPLLAVNLSGTSLNEQSFIDWVLQQVGDATLAQALCFEITETAAVTNLSNATFVMRELKARGCKFALDDFGTGLSSFMYLKTLPVDYLKIDGQFISHVADDPVDRSMVEAICKVGRALGIETVAECVESQAVLDELGRIGIDYAQGYYLAKPEPIERLSL
jgi:EAL domain-containing protein (putative c-di-GMP-specific phosphodiesterase class I)